MTNLSLAICMPLEFNEEYLFELEAELRHVSYLGVKEISLNSHEQREGKLFFRHRFVIEQSMS